MRSKILCFLAVLSLCTTAGTLLSGCKGDSAITPAEEQRFKNPPKGGIPPEALKVMRDHPGGPPQGAAPSK